MKTQLRLSTLILMLLFTAGSLCAQNSANKQEQPKSPAPATQTAGPKLNHVPGYGDSPDAKKTAPVNGVKPASTANKAQQTNMPAKGKVLKTSAANTQK